MTILTNPSPSFNARPLNEQHLSQLAASGISPEVAEEAALRSADAEEVRGVLGRSQGVGTGLLIPYFEAANGNVLQVMAKGAKQAFDFVRVRLDDPRLAPDRNGMPSKYLSRRGSGQHPYILPRVSRQIRSGNAKTILITEGEKKALSAITHGFCAIGISGNFGWKQKDTQAVLPSLELHLPKDSNVVLVWDSDGALNAGFAMSTRMLHENLRRRGVAMKVIVLPQAGADKVGLDDFLVAHGAEAFQRLMDAAKPLPPDHQVDSSDLFEEWSKAFAPALAELSDAEASDLLKKSFRKGLLTAVSHSSRIRILSELKKMAPDIVDAVFNSSVEALLDDRHGTSWRGTNRPEQIGMKGQLDDGARVRVVAAEDRWCWVTTRQARGATWPVPYAQIAFEANSEQEDRINAAKMADEFLRRYYTHENALILRNFRTAFFEWEGNAYREVPDNDLLAGVMGFLRKERPSFAHPRFRASVVENLKAVGACHVPSHATPPCMLGEGHTPRPGILSFSNGNLDVYALRRGEEDGKVWSKPTPLLFNLNGRNFRFEPQAACPRWLAFLKNALPDADLQCLAQELCGYCLIPITSLQRYFLLLGPGANGKGVFSEILITLVGSGNVSAIPLSRFGERFALWPLTTCLVNLAAELPAAEAGGSMRIAEDKLKAVVSGDPIEVERKNKDIVRATPIARLVFTTNELPRFVDRSDGTWRRPIMIPFQTIIPEEKRNHELAAKIKEDEMPGIMNWAIAGLLRLLDRGRFIEPEVCKVIKEQHRLDCAPEMEFLREHVATGPSDAFVYSDDLYAAYRTFVATSGNNSLCRGNFKTAVLRVFPQARADRGEVPGRKRGRGFKGLCFYPEGVPTEDQP